MAATLTLEVATPEKLAVTAEVTEATVPGAGGVLGILPGHAPLISEIEPGELSYVTDGTKKIAVVSTGWVEVSNNLIRVLVDSFETSEEIDVKRAEESLKRAMERLTNPREDLDSARALNAMKRAQARLDIARR